jgi:catechol-2,3-dioxygenase
MTDRPQHAGLRHVALNVKDLSVMENFYRGVMGYAVEWRPDSDNVYMCSGNDNLALHVVGDDATQGFRSLDHIGFIIDNIEDVSKWYDFMREHGVMIHGVPKTHRDGARSFYCEDPEGNAIQIIYHPPISGMTFGPSNREEQNGE